VRADRQSFRQLVAAERPKEELELVWDPPLSARDLALPAERLAATDHLTEFESLEAEEPRYLLRQYHLIRKRQPFPASRALADPFHPEFPADHPLAYLIHTQQSSQEIQA